MHDLNEQATNARGTVRDFFGFPPVEDDVPYPVMVPATMASFADDQDELDAKILDGLIHI